MSTLRKLSDKEEQEVAIAYLCGIDTAAIRQTWDVSPATVTHNIVRKRSQDWKDPLVEFYRKTDAHDRLRNSAHYYLSVNGVVIENHELVDRRRHELFSRSNYGRVPEDKVYGLIEKIVYWPRNDELVASPLLNEFVSSSTGIERLIDNIFGQGHVERTVLPLVLEGLHKAYQAQGERFSLPHIYFGIRNAMVQKIKQGGLAMTPAKIELLNGVLSRLKPRDREVLELRYGLSGHEPWKTLEEVGRKMNVTRERVRHMEVRALGKLRHPALAKMLGPLRTIVTEEELRASLDESRAFEKYYAAFESEYERKIQTNRSVRERVRKLLETAEGPVKSSNDKRLDELLERNVDELELSVRSYNCLRNADIRTVGALVQKTEGEMLRYRNFGRKGLEEIKDILSEMGLSLGMRLEKSQ